MQYREQSSSAPEAAPGAWLRLAALGAAAATALVVVSGALQLDVPHKTMGVLAAPLLVAVVLAAWGAHPRLLRISSIALGLFVLESAIGAVVALGGNMAWAHGMHLAFAALAFAAALLSAAAA